MIERGMILTRDITLNRNRRVFIYCIFRDLMTWREDESRKKLCVAYPRFLDLPHGCHSLRWAEKEIASGEEEDGDGMWKVGSDQF